MKIFIMMLFGIIALSACHKSTIGYLETERAFYAPDTMVVRKVLDVNGVDKNRAKYKFPWVTNSIQSVTGTAQILVTVKNVTTTNGNPEKMMQSLKVRGDGAMELPIENEVPAGRYLISLRFSNRGYTKDVDDCFTIIVK